MIARSYQTETADSIELNKVNLVCAPMRSGKSYMMKLIIDKYQFKKVLIVIGYRKIVQQLSSYFPSHTHILSGLPFDHTKQVHLASFQTLSNRDIDLSEYDCIIQDEYHSRTSKSANEVVFQPNCTTILFTGTPLTNSNKLLIKGIDNFIQPITVKEMIDNNWLAPTRFLSNSTILGDHAKELSTNKQDFDESIVRQIIQKEDMLNNIVTLVDNNHLDTLHKTLIYVNYIETADELYNLLSKHNNVFVVHSKLSNKQQEDCIAAYQAADAGILINVRALSLGFDSPTTDTLIYATFTKIHSLCLQIMWRASTIDQNNPNKVATVYDMTGQLAFVNPYTDFKSYSKKLSCKDQCKKQYPTDLLAQYFCMESCKSEPILVPCTGELPYSLVDNPFISNFQVHAGTPCKESRPVWEFAYKQTDPKPGILKKWSKCKCGCVTSYEVKTLTDPSEMVQVYDNDAIANTVTIIYSAEHHKALGLFDDFKQTKYKILMFESSTELYEHALKFFKGRPFQILSNATMSKLPNVSVDPGLNDAIPLIHWHTENRGFIRQLIKAKMGDIITYLDIKPGWLYYTMKNINHDNEKSVLNFLNQQQIDRAQFLRFFKKLTPKD